MILNFIIMLLVCVICVVLFHRPFGLVFKSEMYHMDDIIMSDLQRVQWSPVTLSACCTHEEENISLSGTEDSQDLDGIHHRNH